MIVLKHADWRAEIAPEIGGATLSLTHRGRAILRPTPEGATDVLLTACFPLVPYANRIAEGRFVFDGEDVDIGTTPGFEPHALHGLGWRTPWMVQDEDTASVILTLRHPGDSAWPWAFEAEQRIMLSDEGLSIALAMTNTDARTAPAGLGLHPYLHRLADARLTLHAARVWLSDETLIPNEAAPVAALFDWSEGPAVADAPFVDNAYDDWTGTARLDSTEGPVELSSPATRRAHVYAPKDVDFVCVEPVTHRPNALNAPVDEPSGLAVLAPGQTLSIAMTIRV